MTLFVILVLVALMLAVLAVLAAGLVNLARASEAEIRGDTPGDGPSDRALRSNKLMWMRIYLQFGAIGVIAILLLIASAQGN